MDRDGIKRLLEAVRAHKLSVGDAFARLRVEPLERLAEATLDIERALRRGFPEAIYGPGKTPDQLVEIIDQLAAREQTVLVTRVSPEVYAAVADRLPRAEYHALPRTIVVRSPTRVRPRSGVLVISAGTADLPVAEEAALTAELAGCGVERIWDVGVAGLHRLLAHREQLTRARVIVVVAGMEGALASVVAGLVDCPVIGVPTSVGYGVGRPGETALHAMLGSCAGGLTVVNIDNGFGAGLAAAAMLRIAAERRSPAATTSVPKRKRK